MDTGLGISGEPRMGNPKQERERAATHFGVLPTQVTPEMIKNLPARGTGLAQSDIDILAEAIANKIKEGKFEEDTGAAILILHSIPSSHGSPGIMVDPDIAARTPCKCYDNICFSRGIIGALSEAQREAYCPTTEHVTSPGMTRRLKNWQEAVGVCKGEIEKYEKGERLIPYIECIGRELPKRGIEI